MIELTKRGKNFLNIFMDQLGEIPDEETAIDTLDELASFTDGDTGHIERVGKLSALLAGFLGYDKEETQHIEVAARWHDVGKIAVYSVISSDRKLSPQERIKMQQHTNRGAEIIAIVLKKFNTRILELAYWIALYHHQNYVGKGYPQIDPSNKNILYKAHDMHQINKRALLGTEIIPYALIASISDCFDALVDPNRPYRKKSFSLEQATKLVLEDDFTGLTAQERFGPRITQVFKDNLSIIYDKYNEWLPKKRDI